MDRCFGLPEVHILFAEAHNDRVNRLPWQKHPEGGFIAYPEGERFKTRFAAIGHDQASSVPWQWRIVYDAARRADHAHTKQGAADAVTAAWPAAKAEATRLAGIAAEREALRTNVRPMMAKGDLPLSIFEIATAPSERLTTIIWLVKDAGGLEGPAKPLVEACSLEPGRRRTAGDGKADDVAQLDRR